MQKRTRYVLKVRSFELFLLLGYVANMLFLYLTEKCMTTSERGFEDFIGPQKGVECIFPMKLGGKTYHRCVPDDNSCNWCSTKGNMKQY